ncbi:winged helix-turn-helix domain-containing protein [Micromonospora craniellae]|uniref:GntR family transcriptional regulator n=1 Tax=Micromonospora craniellae TaxID=2294034 RepID=A0A372FXM4_9ACTN|nr:winged helix-turn-helix domain-containing protein [Micromonospora craniellae]QOC90089.1 winged helix-turn-helix transcriptional regulator [Micromonospora craniellae]RFS45286.1 GntR family transcriptional regulator [Micromonospora craniellae]
MPAVPDYLRIANGIMSDVESGKTKPGEKLPSIAQLCELHGVGASTIRQVFIRLEALEVIDRHQGKGVFVTDPGTWLRKP